MPYPKYHNIFFREEELVKGYQLYTNVKNGNFVWLLYLSFQGYLGVLNKSDW